ncbi:MAG: glycosyltransferase [Gemmataceae bacterium]
MLFLMEAVALAHVARPLVLARWAQENAYDVTIACGSAYADIVRAKGFEPVPVPTILPQTFCGRIEHGQFFYQLTELMDYVRAELALYECIRPDLVIADFRHSAVVSTAVAGLPLVSLANAYWSPAHPCRFSPPANLFRKLPNWVVYSLFACLRPWLFRTFGTPILNELRNRFGQPLIDDFREHYTAGVWCAYLDLPELVPVANLPANHFHLGPVIWQPTDPPPLHVKHTGCRPLAYVSMGSTGDLAVLPKVLHALMEANFNCTVSGVSDAGAKQLCSSMPRLASRARFAPLVSPGEVLESAALTVCHGGNGTVYQSLREGVPVLCLPSNPDQALMAAAVVEQGAGLAVNPSRTNLRSHLKQLASHDSFRRAAEKIARTMAAHDSKSRWLDFLEQVVPSAINEFIPGVRTHG